MGHARVEPQSEVELLTPLGADTSAPHGDRCPATPGGDEEISLEVLALARRERLSHVVVDEVVLGRVHLGMEVRVEYEALLDLPPRRALVRQPPQQELPLRALLDVLVHLAGTL